MKSEEDQLDGCEGEGIFPATGIVVRPGSVPRSIKVIFPCTSSPASRLRCGGVRGAVRVVSEVGGIPSSVPAAAGFLGLETWLSLGARSPLIETGVGGVVFKGRAGSTGSSPSGTSGRVCGGDGSSHGTDAGGTPVRGIGEGSRTSDGWVGDGSRAVVEELAFELASRVDELTGERRLPRATSSDGLEPGPVELSALGANSECAADSFGADGRDVALGADESSCWERLSGLGVAGLYCCSLAAGFFFM